mmetsp:Transcript_7359/g.22489  ORF Transcript_7359/g.22489 Transcript_7359/m.22489 type:complete len:97 (+) Transcript_7359:714-1004(+)
MHHITAVDVLHAAEDLVHKILEVIVGELLIRTDNLSWISTFAMAAATAEKLHSVIFASCLVKIGVHKLGYDIHVIELTKVLWWEDIPDADNIFVFH